jgi:hypothetical protein
MAIGAAISSVGKMTKKVIKNNPFTLNDAFNIGGAYMVYNSARNQGDSKAVSIGKTAADFALGELLGGWQAQLLFYGSQAVGQVLVGTAKANAEAMNKMREVGSGFVGSGSFNMSGAGYTMRQRALNQIRNNGTQINSVLGNEARTYSRSNAYD